jgi:hypothetical protein
MPTSYRMSASAAAKWIRGLPDRVVTHLMEAEKENALEVLQVAIELSSGTVSEEAMIDWRPFSKFRHSVAQLPAFIINEQHGEFIAGWWVNMPRVVNSTSDGVVIRTTLSNRSRQAKELLRRGGTKLAHERPIFQAIKARCRENIRRRRRDALRDAVRED